MFLKLLIKKNLKKVYSDSLSFFELEKIKFFVVFVVYYKEFAQAGEWKKHWKQLVSDEEIDVKKNLDVTRFLLNGNQSYNQKKMVTNNQYTIKNLFNLKYDCKKTVKLL